MLLAATMENKSLASTYFVLLACLAVLYVVLEVM